MEAHLTSRLLSSALVTVVLATQPPSAGAQPPARSITLGDVHTLHSAILGEDRELQITLPATYSRTMIRYPVLFLLDGSSHLLHATATTRFLASARNRIPELIVVAIPNRNRNRDMTPGAGAATFQRVLADEIIPWVEQRYRTAPERVLAGHSLSASFAVHTLLNRPELFDAYIAASAPLWRYENLAGDLKDGLSQAAKAGAAVYLTVGQHENDRLRDGVRRFRDALAAAPHGTAPAWSYVDMPGEDHSSTPERTLYAGLEWRYASYRFPFFETADELERAGGVSALESHYARVGAQLGFTAHVPEARLAQAAAILIASGRHDDVLALASRHRAAYPALAERLTKQAGETSSVSSKVMPDGRQWTTTNVKAVVDGSFCYADAAANCQRYGRLYTWSAAPRACAAVGEGWRLPTNEEWQQMARAFGGVRGDSADGGASAYVALSAGGRSGFDAVLGGGRTPNGEYARLDAHGFYWTATESSPEHAWIYNLGAGGRILNRHDDGEKSGALAVRCIRN